MESSGSSAPEAQPLVEPKKPGGSRALLVVLIAIIIVLAGALAYTSLKLLAQPTPTPSGGTFSVQSAQPTGVQGQPLRFVVSNLKQGAKARISFGDGQVLETTDSTFNYSYSIPGNYLVWVQQIYASNGTVVNDYSASLFKVTIVPDIPFELSQFVSVPTIYFNTTQNPTAPIFAVNSPVYVYGNYTEISQLGNSPGGPFSFDPQIDYETTGFEVVVNTQATLLFYNSNSTTVWFPYLASDVPTVANGGITGNFQTYTFHLRPDVAFSNGDPVTAYDVWYSTIRSILFQGGRPGTADWIISQYLLSRSAPILFSPFTPVVNDTNKAAAFTAITQAVTYDNPTNNVTFHLATPIPPSLFFTAISDPLGMGVLDAAWLKTVGADITFTPDGFLAYEEQAKEGNYNTQTQVHPVASGPFEINTYVPSTAVVLTPNPYFPGIPSIPKQNNTIILEWVSSPAVAYQLYVSGQGDIVTLLPPPYYKALNQLPAGQTVIHGPFPSITEFFDVFNVNITTSLIATAIGPGYTIPSDYSGTPLLRKAFAYAFNYTNYVDNVLGNKKYGFNFGSPYCGVIVNGLPYYVPPIGLTVYPYYYLDNEKSL